MKYKVGLCIVGFLALSSCSKVSSAIPTLSCNIASAGICTDFDSATPSATAQQYCTNVSGTYSSTSACSTTNRVGSCAFTTSGVSLTQRYYSPTFDASSAQSSCTGSSGGTFTAN